MTIRILIDEVNTTVDQMTGETILVRLQSNMKTASEIEKKLEECKNSEVEEDDRDRAGVEGFISALYWVLNREYIPLEKQEPIDEALLEQIKRDELTMEAEAGTW